jgi:hypothetical protein
LAFGHFIHWTRLDDIDSRVPPPINADRDAWNIERGHPYGAFILSRFTKWEPSTQELTLAYLVSAFNPYQVQVMRTRLRMPFILAHAADIYAIKENGDMLFYKHLGYRDGSANWWPGRGTQIGNGWNFKQVFAGPEGAIYAITDSGDMLFYRHLGYKDGSASWLSGGGTKIGNGWNFKQVFAGPEGAIYAINDAGDMLFYRHLGYKDGSANWLPGGGTKIGNGWDFVQVTANNSVSPVQ